jgi:pimeloyl-ACP methyl ester carboxylesterase
MVLISPLRQGDRMTGGARTAPEHALELLERQPAHDEGRTPLLFVHGLGHGAWCWEHWLEGAAEAGHPAYALSLRGHAQSEGRLRTALLGHYVHDVVRTATSLGRPTVLVGHSMGGLVVQQALARYASPAAVLVASVSAHPAVGALMRVARRHPTDALRILGGGSLPLRPEYLFNELPPDAAERHVDRCHGESGFAQYQLIFHRRPRRPLGRPSVLVLATPDDPLLPTSSIRSTAAWYDADLREFPGIGHDLMLDTRWREPLDVMLGWLRERGL